jgi:DNA-binding NarL/FixJ family response regulator
MKILVCDDHALFREGLRHVLRELNRRAELVEAGSADDALRLAATHADLDLVLLDLHLPGTDGRAALRAFRTRHPTLPVVIVSASEEVDDVRAALDGGASGYIPKSASGSVLRGALQLVLAGSVYVPPAVLAAAGAHVERPAAARRESRRDRASGLTNRQLEVLELMARGLTNKDIARVLAIAQGTVKGHIASILEILDVSNRTEAVTVMHELGLKKSEAS